MTDEIRVILVGMGGYGEVYLGALLDEPELPHLRLVAAVDPAPQRCRRWDEVRARAVTVYASMEDVAEWGERCLTIVSSPIQHHCEQTLFALARGSDVLCEKPAAASVEDVDRMIAASAHHGRFVAIGFQWSFTPAILALKRDLARGVFGPPRRAKSLTLWPRSRAYYERNRWAGRVRDPEGRLVLDSPANNAMAHDLHNLLFLLGDELDAGARPVEVRAETRRAYDIETFDTITARVRTEGGAELLFLASHVAETPRDPTFEIECTAGVIRYPGADAPITAELADGTRRLYASPWSEDQMGKLWACARALDGDPLPCTAATARAQASVVEAVHARIETRPFPPARVRRVQDDAGERLFVPGLDDDLRRRFAGFLGPDD